MNIKKMLFEYCSRYVQSQANKNNMTVYVFADDSFFYQFIYSYKIWDS